MPIIWTSNDRLTTVRSCISRRL